MIAILSPAKNMRAADAGGLPLTRSRFIREASSLAAQLKGYEPWQLESLLKINPELAFRAFENFQHFSSRKPGTPALLAYHGLAFQHLDAATLSQEDFRFAEQHLRVLSAFYGVLRPADGILPYRLEFQCGVKVDGGNLYRFWGDRIYRELFRTGQPVVNLASAEYAKTVTPYLTGREQFITCDFLVRKAGKLRCVATRAKMARGQMARYLVQNRICHPQGLQSFDQGGFSFVPELSSETHYIFTAE